jgi:hypothetical protein
MKKNFPLQQEGLHPDRVLEAVKHEIRKYFKRERNRALPKEVDFWDFDCKVGLTADAAQGVRVSGVIEALDALAKDGASLVYVEILSKHGVRVLKEPHLEEHPLEAPLPDAHVSVNGPA